MSLARAAAVPIALVLGIGLVFGACGDDSGGPQLDQIGRLEVTDGAGTAIADGGTLRLSGFDGVTVTARNTGDNVLLINSVSVNVTPGDALELGGLGQPALSADNPVSIQPGGTFDFQVYLSTSVTEPDQVQGQVVIGTSVFRNSAGDADTSFAFNIKVNTAGAQLLVQPGILNFQEVPTGSPSIRTLALLNTGIANLEISRFYLSGHPGFEVKFGETTWVTSVETAGVGITLDPPLVIQAGESSQVDVTYRANGPDGANGRLLLDSNSYAGQTEVQLLANVSGPCIKVVPERVAFGGKEVGVSSEISMEVRSCGELPLVISGVEITDDGGGVFTMNADAVGSLPVTVEPGSSIVVPLSYLPIELAGVTNGQPDLDYGNIEIQSNAFLTNLEIELSGYGTDGTCPEAVITVAEGDEVIPQTVLHLTGQNSITDHGLATAFEWEVIAPQGSASAFLPSNNVMNPTFTANIVGQYIFKLKVWDSEGTPSCDVATYTVLVTSDEAIHVELLWHTPADDDETDEGAGVGTDLDLHFLHPFAGPMPSALGDFYWDCFFGNPKPNWAGNATDDNPRLDRDDVDGGGPENLNLTLPEFGVQYQVAVHYYEDSGFGQTQATVRFFVYGNLVESYSNVSMMELDLWQVGSIDWPGGIVTLTYGAPNQAHITPNVSRPQ